MKAKNVPFYFKAVKSEDGTSSMFYGVASTAALDRDREILLPRGMDSSNFEKNPVMLLSHNYYGLPIGKIGVLDVTDEDVKFPFEFAETDEAQEVKSLYEGGFMHAFSVSFIPKQYYWIEETTPDIVTVTLADGSEQKIDLNSYEVRPRGIIIDWELLEVSAVSIPANPEALIQRSFEHALNQLEDPTRKNLFRSQTDGVITGLIDQVKTVLADLEHPGLKGAIKAHTTPVVEQAWDAPTAKSNLAVFASEDGTGEKETLDWGTFSRGFGWFDDEKINLFTGYKFCHHDIVDGKLVAVWAGVEQAMKSVLASKSQEDREAVYAHLCQHYRDYDHEPPELKEYTDAELEKAFTPMPAKSEDDPVVKTADADKFTALLDSRLKELEETVVCRIGVLSRMVMESLTSADNSKGNTATTEEPLETDDMDADAYNELSGLFKELGAYASQK